MKHDLRLSSWELRFDALLHSRRRTPFKWGEHDCAIFAADAVLAITGVDHAQELRGMGVRDAIRTVHQRGGLEAVVTSFLGEPGRPDDAREGDVVLMPNGDRVGLSVCVGNGKVVAAAPVGLAWLPMTDAICAWRVG